jgi:hypothetical protein
MRCSGYGQAPGNPIERAEVSMTWLLLDATEPVGTERVRAESMGLVERGFCRGCVPTVPIADLECVRCGDGPLLGGDLAADDVGDDGISPMVQAWMSSAGWRLSGPVCPDCVGELAR